ncbi:MAG: hypothetical protein EOO47_17380 [Flavobacterium sp.]|nr:MAG: hypothetical protein EOO47_17380 [Flavobacterium sp.]
MKPFGKFFLVVIILLITNIAYGQNGCLISTNSTVYTEQDNSGLINAVLAIVFGGNPVYKSSPNQPSISACIANSQIRWTGGAQNCTVCPFGYDVNLLGVITGCQTSTFSGKVATSQIIQCPLDDYSWAFVASAAAFGIFVIRKRNKFL